MFVDDRPPDATIASNFNAIKQDRILDRRPAIDPHMVSQDRVPDSPPRQDRSGADQAVERLAQAGFDAGCLGKHKLRRRFLGDISP